jgi:hypothetical protein
MRGGAWCDSWFEFLVGSVVGEYKSSLSRTPSQQSHMLDHVSHGCVGWGFAQQHSYRVLTGLWVPTRVTNPFLHQQQHALMQQVLPECSSKSSYLMPRVC